MNRTRRIERLEAVLLTDDSRDAAGPSAHERLTAEIERLASRMAESGAAVPEEADPDSVRESTEQRRVSGL